MGKVPEAAADREMKKGGSYKIYLNKQKDLMSKKQQKEKEMLEKMSDEQKDEVLKEKKRKETERKALYRMKKKLENKQCNNKKFQLHQKMHINLVPAREKPLQGSREISLVVLRKE